MARRGTTAKIDLRELEKLCAMQATDEEVAAFFEVSVRTIERRRKNPRFAEIMSRGKAKGRLSVRRLQMKMLEQGNATMGVWLGKQILGQSDYTGPTANGPGILIVVPSGVINRAALTSGTTTAQEAIGCSEAAVIDIG